MSAATERLPRAQAAEIAADFVSRIDPVCRRIQVAGSLRRGLRSIGDIEIVAAPTLLTPKRYDLFGELVPADPIDCLGDALDSMLASGTVVKRARDDGRFTWGPYAKRFTYRDVPVDLFSPEWDRFGWILALRTGPAAFSRQLVVERGDFTKDRRPGLRPKHVHCSQGWLTWTSGERISTPEEGSVFDLFGLVYREPWVRS